MYSLHLKLAPRADGTAAFAREFRSHGVLPGFGGQLNLEIEALLTPGGCPVRLAIRNDCLLPADHFEGNWPGGGVRRIVGHHQRNFDESALRLHGSPFVNHDCEGRKGVGHIVEKVFIELQGSHIDEVIARNAARLGFASPNAYCTPKAVRAARQNSVSAAR